MSETTGTRFETLFEHTSDAVAEVEFVDGEPIVRAVNPRFVDVFGFDGERIRGEPLTDYVSPVSREGKGEGPDRRSADTQLQQGHVTRQTATGARQFYCRVAPTTGDRALAIYADVTDERRREQHHQILHRVLRHNLRNKLIPLLDGTETLSAELSGDLGEQASLMAMAAQELAKLSETAGKIEYVMESTAAAGSPINLVESLRSVLEEYDDSATVDLSIEGTETMLVAADDRLEIALAHLVENGVKHTDGEPILSVSLRRESGEAVAEISDDGPGLPENERAVLFGEEPITQLRHSTGLGLWLTKWILDRHGGHLSYERCDGRTTITLRVPLATEAAVVVDDRSSQRD
ncbi:MAG: ATP-binding protein [Haloarcula sp.]